MDGRLSQEDRAVLNQTLIQLAYRLREFTDPEDRTYFGDRLFRMARELLPPEEWRLVSRVLLG
jgi:hypothetical protein